MTQSLSAKEKMWSVLRTNVVDLIGNTPLVKLDRITRGISESVEVWAKLESSNPGGSGKDRPAKQIVEDAFAAGTLNTDMTLIDASTGSIGVGYAICGASMGFPVTLIVPDDVEKNGRTQMTTAEVLGAKIIRSKGGIEGARKLAEKMSSESPGTYFYANQFGNPSNARAHRLTTAMEIFRQTQSRVTHFVSSVGTGGTLSGVGEGLQEKKPAIEIIACKPDAETDHESMQRIESRYIEPKHTYEVSIKDASKMARRLAEEEGIRGGIVSGMNLYGALELAKTLESGVIVFLVSDRADFTEHVAFE